MTTYSTLTTDIGVWTARSFSPAQLTSIMTLTEAQIARDVRVRAMRATNDAFVIGSRRVALPERFLSIIRFRLDQSGGELTFLPPGLFYNDSRYSDQGSPSIYTIEGSDFVFGPEPAESYTGMISYYQRFESLSSPDDTNWLLQNHYNVYLHCALSYAFKMIRDNDEAMAHGTLASSYIRELGVKDQYSAIQANALIRSGGSTP